MAKKASKKKASKKSAPRRAAKKAAKKGVKKASKKASKKAAKKKSASKSKGGAKGGGFMKNLNLSGDLAAVIGSQPVPRTQIIKKLWVYIKKNNLQDKNNRRMINADSKLRVVFGGKSQVSMFELAKVINNHVS